MAVRQKTVTRLSSSKTDKLFLSVFSIARRPEMTIAMAASHHLFNAKTLAYVIAFTSMT